MLLKERLWILHAGGEEVATAGQAYYLPPGHHVAAEENRELVKFNPQHDHPPTLQVPAIRRGRFFITAVRVTASVLA
ncbi:MAG: hypothetical protein U1F70_03080 [Candidatus Competibacteraceae bacterium]